jgi:hypothetical protein
VTKIVKTLDKNLHVSLQLMICQPVALSGYSEGPKVVDTVIEADVPIFFLGGVVEDGPRPTPPLRYDPFLRR